VVNSTSELLKVILGDKMKKLLTPLLLLLAIGFLYAGGQQQRQGKALDWSLGLQNVKTGDLVAFSAPVNAATGEKYRLVIIPEARCYCYVVYESPDGSEMAVLYAGTLNKDEIWFSYEMDLRPPSGSESLFIIVSSEEQKNLAQRISDFNNNPGSLQRRSLLNEIMQIRNDVSKFREVPEKPLIMGGVSRGDPDKSQGVAFSGLATYLKTISIEH